MRLKIHVTQEDINLGEPKKCDNCPVYRAVNRVAKVRSVGYMMTTFGTDPEIVFIDMPKSALDFIEAFDRNKPVVPFSFYMVIPDEYLRNV